jgi:hypothetical protein
MPAAVLAAPLGFGPNVAGRSPRHPKLLKRSGPQDGMLGLRFLLLKPLQGELQQRQLDEVLD